MLRYGDGTPFPHDEAFLDLIEDAVEACATMLDATAELDRQRAEAAAVMEGIGEEERRLVLFERAVAAACGRVDLAEDGPAAQAAEQTRLAMAAAVERARAQLEQRSTEKAPPGWLHTARRVHTAAGDFFAAQALPGTQWAWAWDATGAAPAAEATAVSDRFQAVFDLELAPPWQAPVALEALVPGMVMHLPRRRRFRAPIEDAVPLARCALVRMRRDAGGRELVIRQPTGWSYRLDLPEGGQPAAELLDRRGRVAGTGLVREPELEALLRAIDDAFPAPRLPRRAREVILDGARVTALEDTTLAARALLAVVGPTVRSIRERSLVPGELSLKRDIDDGRREEIYVSRASLAARYGALPPEYRRLFDEAGLGRGLTTQLGELAAASRASIPPQPAPQQPPQPTLQPAPPPLRNRPRSSSTLIRPRRPSAPTPTALIPTLAMTGPRARPPSTRPQLNKLR